MTRSRVLLTAKQRDVDRVDGASGPCVPLPTRKRPLVSVHRQFHDTPEQFSALFGVLGGRPSEAWTEIGKTRGAMLVKLSDHFVDVLADLSRRAIDVPEGEVADLSEIEEVAVRWRQATRWPKRQLAKGLIDRLILDAAWSRVAREKSQDVYCWFGPAVPEYEIVSGTAETLESYLAEKRKRRSS